jgi:hypothetical protein
LLAQGKDDKEKIREIRQKDVKVNLRGQSPGTAQHFGARVILIKIVPTFFKKLSEKHAVRIVYKVKAQANGGARHAGSDDPGCHRGVCPEDWISRTAQTDSGL